MHCKVRLEFAFLGILNSKLQVDMANKKIPVQNNKVNMLHFRLTELHAAHQNLPFPPNRTLPLKQYQYQGKL